MKWLSWSLVDPLKEIGGAEMHALCVGKHLKDDFGVDFEATYTPEDLFDPRFDVVQTHGSALPKKFFRRCLAERRQTSRPLRIHTLHGETLEAMSALGQWHRIGRWKSFFREIRGCLASDLVVSVRANLLLVSLSRALGKRVIVVENGWDSVSASPVVHENRNPRSFAQIIDELDAVSPFALFVGRNLDPQKAFSRLERLLVRDRGLRLVAVPGQELDSSPQLKALGPLSPRQLSEVYKKCRALLLPSAFEGLPLVLLEALAQGCPALVSDIRAHRALAGRGLSNYILVEDADDPRAWIRALQKVSSLSALERANAALNNRARLRSWAQVAAETYAAASSLLSVKRF